MNEKTTDGYDLEKGHYYYLENNQVVILHDWMISSKGVMKYLVSPFYEGTTIDFRLYPSGHTEIESPFEVEGEETIVTKLFKNEVTAKMGAQYDYNMKRIEALSLTIGLMEKTVKEMEQNKKKIENSIVDLEKDINYKISVLKDYLNDEERIEQSIKEKQTQLAELEDSTTEYNGLEKDDVLGYLRKRDFKLTCLENGGVDNWEWYDESLEEYRKRYDS